ncbi:hypothetical protein, partial [Cellulophaga baltica]|uniref:hypothetical protein n=1 Tax=Cellulophaga baltica TaxID=76594 RepID=UPI001C31432C
LSVNKRCPCWAHTLYIANRAVSTESISFVVFTKSAKSFDLAIKKEKKITKCKSFGYGLWGMFGAYPLPYLP